MIEVGEYVKCKDGIIAKIINKSEEDYAERGNILYELDKETFDDTEGFEEYSYYVLPDQFIKYSKNIMDLIEVGDIIVEMEGKIPRVIRINNIEMLDRFRNRDKIYSIVTKEQFKNIEYRLEDTNV